MLLITWGPRLETGITIIDQQHKRLVDIINQLDEAMKSNRSQDIMEAMLDDLVSYTETHFRVEEKLMTKCDYEEFEDHRREHRIFTDQIKMDRDYYEAGTRQFDQKVMDFLRDWLVNHIAVSDRAYVPTLKQGGID